MRAYTDLSSYISYTRNLQFEIESALKVQKRNLIVILYMQVLIRITERFFLHHNVSWVL